MKILIFGKTGQVATELQALASDSLRVEALDRGDADLTDPDACARYIQKTGADAVINAAAYTNVDGAENDSETCHIVNASAPAAMARAAADRNLPLVHISTDYVFNGSGSDPHLPGDPVDPINVYGQSKLDGEIGIRAAGGRHVILRTAWVFSAHGTNFVKSMLKLAEARSTLSVVADQVGGPTHAADIAKAALRTIDAMLDGQAGGTFHFTGTPDVTRADFARDIFAAANLPVTVRDISSEAFPTPAQRPLNSRLDCSDTWEAFGLIPPDWKAGLVRVIEELNDG